MSSNMLAKYNRQEKICMIEQLSVTNYKSLKHLNIPLRPLTAFIGPNASGKSNILDALSVISEIVQGDRLINRILNDRGGYTNCVWGGDVNLEITLKVDFRLSEPKELSDNVLTYGLIFTGGRKAGINLEWVNKDEESDLLRRSENKWHAPTIGGGRADPQKSALQVASGQWKLGNLFLDYLSNWAFYQFNTSAMRSYQPIRKQYRLEKDGHNLSTVLHTLFSEAHPTWDEIAENLAVFLPRAQKLISPIDDAGNTYAAIIEKGVPRPIGTESMSDGTLFALAFATALSSPQMPNVIAIEAPDIEIHPHLMQHLAEMLISASEKTQVLITTHSPYLVTHLPPESLVIVEHHKGETVIKDIPKKKAVMEAIKSLGAGSAWYSGHLGGVP